MAISELHFVWVESVHFDEMDYLVRILTSGVLWKKRIYGVLTVGTKQKLKI